MRGERVQGEHEKIYVWVHYNTRLPDREEILSQPGSLDSFERVTKPPPGVGTNGFDGRELIDRLRVITLLTRPDMEVLTRRSKWAAGTGKTRHTIGRLPDRIRKMADEIELANKGRGVFPIMMAAYRPNPALQPRWDLYTKLPDIMRAYAARLRGAIEEIGKAGGATLARDCRKFHRQLAAKLVADVQQATSCCRYSDLAALLSAACAADGHNVVWAEADLKNLHERSREKWPRPRVLASHLGSDFLCLTIEP